MSRTLSIDALLTLVSIADQGNFALAANARHLTQAAVSQQIRKLEEQIGQAIFQRKGRRMVLTESGELLVQHARKIIVAQDEAMLALQGHDAEGAIRLGVPQDYAEDMLPDVLRRFAQRYPRMRLEVRVEKNQTLLQEAREGKRLDIILLLSDVDAIASATGRAPLARPSIDWLASPDFSWDGDTLPLVLLDAPCMFRLRALEALDAAETPYRIAYSTASLAGARAAVAAGLGLMARIHTQRDRSLGIVKVRNSHRALARKLPSFNKLGAVLWQRDDLSPPAAELAAILRDAVTGDW
jgi:DNA-binding transcriptional LysR family regulator